MRFFQDDNAQRYHDSVVTSEREKAYYRGRLDAMRDALCDDELVQKKVRLDAWKAAGADDGGEIPSGWPEGADREQAVREYVVEQTAHLELSSDSSPTGAPALESESVAAFRKAIGGE